MKKRENPSAKPYMVPALERGMRILELLSELGTVPNSLENAISSENREEILKSWLKLAARAESFSDFAKKAGLEVEISD